MQKYTQKLMCVIQMARVASRYISARRCEGQLKPSFVAHHTRGSQSDTNTNIIGGECIYRKLEPFMASMPVPPNYRGRCAEVTAP